MFGLGTGELIVILAVFTLMFGGRRLPELGRGLGQGLRGFKEALKGVDEPDHDGVPPRASKDDADHKKTL